MIEQEFETKHEHGFTVRGPSGAVMFVENYQTPPEEADHELADRYTREGDHQ